MVISYNDITMMMLMMAMEARLLHGSFQNAMACLIVVVCIRHQRTVFCSVHSIFVMHQLRDSDQFAKLFVDYGRNIIQLE